MKESLGLCNTDCMSEWMCGLGWYDQCMEVRHVIMLTCEWMKGMAGRNTVPGTVNKPTFG